LLPNTYYWFIYNTNGLLSKDNGYSYLEKSGNHIKLDSYSYRLGFPSRFPSKSTFISNRKVASIYATVNYKNNLRLKSTETLDYLPYYPCTNGGLQGYKYLDASDSLITKEATMALVSDNFERKNCLKSGIFCTLFNNTKPIYIYMDGCGCSN